MSREADGKFMKGHKLGGRPRTYTPAKLNALAKSLREWVEKARQENRFVLLSEWCFEVGFNPTAFSIHVENSEDFKEAYQWAKAWQEHVIASGALQKNLDARFSQFFLAVNHGWSIDRERENKEEKQKSNLERLSESIQAQVEQVEEE
jgi:hypothetical protein